jgi:hypothetical protein
MVSKRSQRCPGQLTTGDNCETSTDAAEECFLLLKLLPSGTQQFGSLHMYAPSKARVSSRGKRCIRRERNAW